MQTISLKNGHVFLVERINTLLVPSLSHKENYTEFWRARVPSARQDWFYLARGHKDAPKETVVWYPNRCLWAGFGKSLESALEGAVRDAFLYMESA